MQIDTNGLTSNCINPTKRLITVSISTLISFYLEKVVFKMISYVRSGTLTLPAHKLSHRPISH